MKKEKQLTIVMYHYVRPIKNSKFPKIKGLELHSFTKQLDYLSKNYNFITAEKLILASLEKQDLPNNACYLTFDDGFKDHIRFVLPELLKRNIQGSFFPPAEPIEKQKILDVHAIHFILASSSNTNQVCNDLNNLCIDFGITKSELDLFYKTYATSFNYGNKSIDNAKTIYFKRMLQTALPKNIRSKIIRLLFKKYVKANSDNFSNELYMSISDIKNLIKSGMYVGSHSYSHMFLGNAKKIDQIKEINLSLNFLKKIGARTDNWMMCFPYGNYNKDTLSILREKNCLIGLTTKPGIANLHKSKLLELNRYDTNYFIQ